MKNSGFSFPTTSRALLSIFLILFACVFDCKQDVCCGLARDRLAQKLAEQDYGFLDSIEEDSPPGAEIFGYAPGAGFYLGLAARDRVKNWLAVRFFELELERGEEPWVHEAVPELLALYNEAEAYEKTIAAADAILEKYPAAPGKTAISVLKIEALYWQKQDEAVLSEIAGSLMLSAAELRDQQPEVALFQTVAAARLGRNGWQDLVREFFFTVKAAPLHQRLYTWLVSEKKIKAFSALEQELFEAKNLLGSGEYGNALKKYETVFARLSPEMLAKTTHIADFTTAALSAAPAGRQAVLLLSFASKVATDVRLQLQEAAGRIYYAAKDYGNARANYKTVLEATVDALLKKRLIWRLCKIGLQLNANEALTAFRTYAPLWTDPVYYEDITDELISLLVRERRFQELLNLEATLKPYFAPVERAMLSYIAARALMANLVTLAGGKKEEKIKALLQSAVDDEKRGYYSYLSAFFLSDETPLKIPLRDEVAKSPADTPPGTDELLAAGFIDFGLYERAFALATAQNDAVRNESISGWAALLAERNRPYESLKMVQRLRERGVDEYSRAEYTAYFPKPFSDLVKKQAADYAVDETLFYALLRQESAFHATIRSSAGAIGLAQLMPDTGDWIATQLKIKKPDLMDPATSILFCAYYLSFIEKRLQTAPWILAGYNAGPTTSKNWKQKYGDLPPDLAVEALDYAETRNFIKSIFSAHVSYSIFYETGTLADSVGLFYQF